MPAVARLGDIDDSTSPGSIDGACATTVLINGEPAAIVGATISPHRPGSDHNSATIVVGSDTILCEGQPLARVGDALTCGHSILTGSDDVEAG